MDEKDLKQDVKNNYGSVLIMYDFHSHLRITPQGHFQTLASLMFKIHNQPITSAKLTSGYKNGRYKNGRYKQSSRLHAHVKFNSCCHFHLL